MCEKHERQMKKGVLDMLVLKLLEDEPKYGYQLIYEMQEKSSGIFVLKEGTLYPILYRLEEEGFIMSRWSEAAGRQAARKYYSISDFGKTALLEIYGRWKQILSGVSRIMEEELP